VTALEYMLLVRRMEGSMLFVASGPSLISGLQLKVRAQQQWIGMRRFVLNDSDLCRTD
jgi:hypothetical protein